MYLYDFCKQVLISYKTVADCVLFVSFLYTLITSLYSCQPSCPLHLMCLLLMCEFSQEFLINLCRSHPFSMAHSHIVIPRRSIKRAKLAVLKLRCVTFPLPSSFQDTELLDPLVAVLKASPSAHISRLPLFVIRYSSTPFCTGSSITCYCLLKYKNCGEKKVTGFILFLPEHKKQSSNTITNSVTLAVDIQPT